MYISGYFFTVDIKVIFNHAFNFIVILTITCQWPSVWWPSLLVAWIIIANWRWQGNSYSVDYNCGFDLLSSGAHCDSTAQLLTPLTTCLIHVQPASGSCKINIITGSSLGHNSIQDETVKVIVETFWISVFIRQLTQDPHYPHFIFWSRVTKMIWSSASCHPQLDHILDDVTYTVAWIKTYRATCAALPRPGRFLSRKMTEGISYPVIRNVRRATMATLKHVSMCMRKRIKTKAVVRISYCE